MEEDIDKLEDFLEYNNFLERADASGDIREFEVYISKNEFKAIENLIARYKKLEEENGRLKYSIAKATKIIDEYSNKTEDDTKKIIEYQEKHFGN